MNEIWKDIEGYEGRYQVSNLGRVRSLDITIVQRNYKGILISYTKYGRILKEELLRNGYLRVTCSCNGLKKRYSIHRLVAKTFIPNPQNMPQINHKNENKTDNRVENLEWCSCKYNQNYGTRTKRISESLSKKIEQLDKDGNIVAVHQGIMEAGRAIGKYHGNIWRCCIGIRKKAYGYRWRYADE